MPPASETTNDQASSPFPPPLVTETLQYRLLTGNLAKSGGQKGSLTRCAQKLGLLQQQQQLATTTNDTTKKEEQEDAVTTARDAFLREVQLYQLEATRLLLHQEQLQLQVVANQQEEDRRQAQIQALVQQVEETRQQAHQAQQVQRCLDEYEALAKLANNPLEDDHDGNHPKHDGTTPKSCRSSRQWKQDIATIQQEISQTQDEHNVLEQVLVVRESQFQNLVQTMLDLKRSLRDGEDQVSGTAAVIRQALLVKKANEPKEQQQDGDDDPMDFEEGEDDEGGLYGDL